MGDKGGKKDKAKSAKQAKSKKDKKKKNNNKQTYNYFVIDSSCFSSKSVLDQLHKKI